MHLLVLPHGLAMDRVLETLKRRFEMLETLLELGEPRLIAFHPAGRIEPTGTAAVPEAHGWLSFLSSYVRRPRGRKQDKTWRAVEPVDGVLTHYSQALGPLTDEIGTIR